MWSATCIPSKVYQVLYPLKRHLRWVQARHFLVFCGLLIALIRAPGKGPLQGLKRYLPPTLKYWTTVRMLRSGPWDAEAVVGAMAPATLRTLPPRADGILYLIGDSTWKAKRGRQHPVGHRTRHSAHEPYACGCAMVLLSASWGRCRVPVALAPIDPKIKGHHNSLVRQMRTDVVPPAGVQQVGVGADAGLAAHATLALSTAQHSTYVFAMPRRRKFTHGKPRRDLVPHLPKSCYARRATHKPDGRRRDSWGFPRRATRHTLGDVTMVLSKTRRNEGPQGVKILVTNLPEASAGAMRSM